MNPSNRVSGPRLLFGLVVLAIGLLLTLDRLGVLHAEDYFVFWPTILVAVGLVKLFLGGRGDRILGLVLVGLGGWLQLYHLGWIHEWPGDYFLPAVLLLLGAVLVLGGLRRRAVGPAAADSWVNAFAFWTGLKRRNASADFQGGELTAIMGGIELDLTRARIAGDQAVIHVFSMWGGVEITVPKEWRLDIPLVPLLGGYGDQTEQTPAADAPLLVIKGFVLMAGVDVKN